MISTSLGTKAKTFTWRMTMMNVVVDEVVAVEM
jgi:hypothetical protein